MYEVFVSPQGHTPHSAGAQEIYYSAVPTTWRMMTRIEKVKRLETLEREEEFNGWRDNEQSDT